MDNWGEVIPNPFASAVLQVSPCLSVQAIIEAVNRKMEREELLALMLKELPRLLHEHPEPDTN
ncbi:hypothetical protein Q2T83_14510 [Fervidibacter sacchari]|uniref:Uncharacterized protein n=1 Tax=Candidatus Fervidibacter sacchari TaxID=1448929 RepID=A0ABT2EIH9_9BACT|nr:hypothetical protein [Candidatus Fervidibacter sacchari]MCS3917706.1 hypothetical protein [Candidatus Fervidibacter sacchari]WKU15533.1 hypothetical protein Q2T83_14510 [Candidatus Fervidibacter sacchari]